MINDVMDRKERPAYVSFHRVAVEDKKRSEEEGHYVARDVDYVHITPPYSKDVMKFKVPTWLEQMKVDVGNGRLPEEWANNYRRQYEAWKQGQELPVEGFPIKGWGQISPAQQETLVQMNIRTVEDLAAVNDEGLRRIGMSGLSLKTKATAWLAQNTERGPITQKMAALTQENASLQGQIEALTRQLQELASRVPEQRSEELERVEITASDLVDDPKELYTQKFGKPPHHRMKTETILEALKG